MSSRYPAVERACDVLAGASAVSVARAARGPLASVYRVVLVDGRRVVVKLFAPRGRHDAGAEALALRAVAESGRVAVPEVVGVGPVPGFAATALVSDDVGSDTLGDLVRAGLVAPERALGRLGALLGAFHGIAAPVGVPMSPGVIEQASAVVRRCPALLVPRVRPALEVIVDRCADAAFYVWCHGDLHWDNAMIAAAGLQHLADGGAEGQLAERVVDFEGTTLCVPEYDVAQTLVTCDALTPTTRAAVVAAYGRPLDRGLLDALVVFQAVRGWTFAAHVERRDRAVWAPRLHRVLHDEGIRA
ncbi:phosphotransferase family protein [Streptomyces violascens]|uniref:phosphotransferase family protein n=1 Tax=Streptomyces violascens TaxID=67381 RepID=UPI003796F7DA